MGRRERESEKKLWRQRDEARAELAALKAQLGTVYDRAQQAMQLEQQLVVLQGLVLDAQAATRRAEAEAQRVNVTVDAWHARAVSALDAAVAAEREEQRATIDKLTQRISELEAALASETVEDNRTLRKRLAKKAEEERQLKAENAGLRSRLEWTLPLVSWIDMVLKNADVRQFLEAAGLMQYKPGTSPLARASAATP